MFLSLWLAIAAFMSLAELAKMADAGKAKYQLQKLCLTYAEKVMPLRTQGPKLLSTTLCPYKRLAYIAGLRDWMRVAQLQCSLCRKGAKPKDAPTWTTEAHRNTYRLCLFLEIPNGRRGTCCRKRRSGQQKAVGHGRT